MARMETMNNPSPKFGEWLCASVPRKPNARFQFGVQREALETQAGSLLLKNDEVDMGTKVGSTLEEYLGNEKGGEGIWLELVMKVGLANSMKDLVLRIGPNSLNGAAEDFNKILSARRRRKHGSRSPARKSPSIKLSLPVSPEVGSKRKGDELSVVGREGWILICLVF
ncbi:hypothetical protein ACOSQ4_019538 [Xanthoceras sorbifolium]